MSRLNVLIVDMWYHFLIKSNNTTSSRLKEFYKAVRIWYSFVLISFITVIVMSERCKTRCTWCTSADGLVLPKTIEYNDPSKQLIISCRHLCHTKVFEVSFLFLFLLHLFISNTFLTACVSFFHLIKIIECFLNKRMTFWQSLYTSGTYGILHVYCFILFMVSFTRQVQIVCDSNRDKFPSSYLEETHGIFRFPQKALTFDFSKLSIHLAVFGLLCFKKIALCERSDIE